MDVSHNPISLDQWKAIARRGEAPPADSRLRKQYVCDSIKNEGDGKTYTFTISTGAIDRDKDTLAVEGWNVGNFLKAGGPVLWAHQSRDLPIGKAPWVRAQAGSLKARVEFAPADVYPFAETVRRLVDFGALKATSVGFLPDFAKSAWNEERGGFDFKGQELLEFSIVPVPANPEALMDAKDAGIDLSSMKVWAEGILDGTAGPGLWVPKDHAEAVFKLLAEPRVVVPAFDFEPYLADARAACEKRGRVLSAENESSIRSAHDGVSAAAASLAGVLAQCEEEAPEPMKAAPEPEPPVLFLEKEPTYAVEPSVLVAAVRAAVSESVREVVNAARGRLD